MNPALKQTLLEATHCDHSSHKIDDFPIVVINKREFCNVITLSK
jgi:hypothetical protein